MISKFYHILNQIIIFNIQFIVVIPLKILGY